MRLRNGEHGYGVVSKTLHWLTVLAVAAQFAVGYTMDDDGDVAETECEVGNGRELSEAEEERLERLEERCEAEQDRREEESDDAVASAWSDLASGDLFEGGVSLPEGHVLLGLLIIVIGVLRLLWRRTAPLPPWDARLSAADRRWLHRSEVSLLVLQFVVPLSGVLLVLGNDDLVAVHVAAHVAFFAALAAHVGIVLGRGLLSRMLPWGRVRNPAA